MVSGEWIVDRYSLQFTVYGKMDPCLRRGDIFAIRIVPPVTTGGFKDKTALIFFLRR